MGSKEAYLAVGGSPGSLEFSLLPQEEIVSESFTP